MRVCGLCHQTPYPHDPFGELWVHDPDSGITRHYQTCSECIRQYDPDRLGVLDVTAAGPPRAGGPVAHLCDNLYCGICRRYAREGSRMHVIRLAPEDVHDAPDVKPGAYMCCPDCVGRYAFRIWGRLVETGVLPNMAAATEGHLL